MPLADDIRALRDRTLAELTATYDYFTDSQVAWKLTREAVEGGKRFTLRSHITGTVTRATELVEKSEGYISGRLTEATFQQFIATFEHFLLELLRLWLTAYPGSLGTKTVEFKTILEAADKDAITAQVVDHELYQLLYKRPAEWFAYLSGRMKLPGPTKVDIDQFAEAKATRDVLVHNRGVANKTYLSKAG